MSGIKDCCKDLSNREDGTGPRGGEVPEDVTVTHCTVCDCRHFEVDAETGNLGLLGASL